MHSLPKSEADYIDLRSLIQNIVEKKILYFADWIDDFLIFNAICPI